MVITQHRVHISEHKLKFNFEKKPFVHKGLKII